MGRRVFVEDGAHVGHLFVDRGPFGADTVEVRTDGRDRDAEALINATATATLTVIGSKSGLATTKYAGAAAVPIG